MWLAHPVTRSVWLDLDDAYPHPLLLNWRISSRISSTRHAVVRGPSLTGFGNLPLLTPAHHVDFPTGIGPFGAIIEGSLTNPVPGSSTLMRPPHSRIAQQDAFGKLPYQVQSFRPCLIHAE